jgi:hypothetical protein
MLTTVFSGLSAIGELFVKLADAAFKWAGVIFAYRLGASRERQKQNDISNRIKDEQLRIAARSPLDRALLLKRMRERRSSE